MTDTPEDGFASPEFMRNLQLVTDSEVRIGVTITTDENDEPAAGRAMLLTVNHRTNKRHDDADSSTVFGLSQGHALDLTGRLLLGIDMAFGGDVVNDLLTHVAQIAGAAAAAGDDA